MNTNPSHEKQVLNHLKAGNTITQAEAIQLFDCYRLGSSIHRLRKAGYAITTYNEPNINRAGTHARYELERNDNEAVAHVLQNGNGIGTEQQRTSNGMEVMA